jgi:hypothetical protein
MHRASGGDGAGARTWLSWLGLGGRSLGVLLATVGAIGVLSACQSTAEHSAELEKSAKHERLALRGISVTRENPNVRVVGSTVVHSNAGTAVVVALRNTSKRTIVDAPIEITVRDAKGAVLFQNDQPGADSALTHVSLLEAGREAAWVDDQVQIPAPPGPPAASASAVVGPGTQPSGSVPSLRVSGTTLGGEGEETGASGTVTNLSKVPQEHLVVYALARKAGRIVAAGRAVLPEVGAGASVPFQAYFVGDPRGARIEASAPATTF